MIEDDLFFTKKQKVQLKLKLKRGSKEWGVKRSKAKIPFE